MWKSFKILGLITGFIMIQSPAFAGSILDILSAPPLLIKAERAFDRGSYGRVVELLDGKAADIGKYNAQSRAYSLLCQAQAQLGQAPAAIESCTVSVSYAPIHWADLNARGGAYYDLGQYGKASADFAKAAELAPFNHQVKINLRVAERAGRNQLASK